MTESIERLLREEQILEKEIRDARAAFVRNDSISERRDLQWKLVDAEGRYDDFLHGELLVALHNHYGTWAPDESETVFEGSDDAT